MRSLQRGLSYWGILFGVSFFAMLIKVAATVGPIYLDYITLTKMIEAKFRETQVDKFEVPKFKKDLEAQMEMNGLRDRKVDDLMTVLKDGGKLMLEIDYEERRNLMANLDVVVHFKKSYTSDKPDGFTE
ncbi:MAG: DUF4845 domain-containing protein [Moraxellaceae bacterium]|nr:DUF4845 domain-containing protein [Pseudomonadales bacterium]MCB1673697.1 DUF4845 domain-containing protein [Pseudomonadales bacterium]MCP5175465.1 DUF4845 domain-containing protein [Moraxellaceae bacterium]MCP5176022.1 DUF4845 domain-containing protein [Moraxellaceae bacterium]HQV21622.1 DUF4845 domain-containing protein [Agitococcus sp.]